MRRLGFVIGLGMNVLSAGAASAQDKPSEYYEEPHGYHDVVDAPRLEASHAQSMACEQIIEHAIGVARSLEKRWKAEGKRISEGDLDISGEVEYVPAETRLENSTSAFYQCKATFKSRNPHVKFIHMYHLDPIRLKKKEGAEACDRPAQDAWGKENVLTVFKRLKSDWCQVIYNSVQYYNPTPSEKQKVELNKTLRRMDTQYEMKTGGMP
jgi:hypothetical protein